METGLLIAFDRSEPVFVEPLLSSYVLDSGRSKLHQRRIMIVNKQKNARNRGGGRSSDTSVVEWQGIESRTAGEIEKGPRKNGSSTVVQWMEGSWIRS